MGNFIIRDQWENHETDGMILTEAVPLYINNCTIYYIPSVYNNINIVIKWLRLSRGSVLAFSTQVRGFKPGRSRRIFRAKKSSSRLPSEGK